MRLLIISNNYNPDANPRGWRWSAIAEACGRGGFAGIELNAGADRDEEPEARFGSYVLHLRIHLYGRKDKAGTTN